MTDTTLIAVLAMFVGLVLLVAAAIGCRTWQLKRVKTREGVVAVGEAHTDRKRRFSQTELDGLEPELARANKMRRADSDPAALLCIADRPLPTDDVRAPGPQARGPGGLQLLTDKLNKYDHH